MVRTSPTPGMPPALLPVAVKVIVYGGNLYTETGVPLYRYVPLVCAAHQHGQAGQEDSLGLAVG